MSKKSLLGRETVRGAFQARLGAPPKPSEQDSDIHAARNTVAALAPRWHGEPSPKRPTISNIDERSAMSGQQVRLTITAANTAATWSRANS